MPGRQTVWRRGRTAGANEKQSHGPVHENIVTIQEKVTRTQRPCSLSQWSERCGKSRGTDDEKKRKGVWRTQADDAESNAEEKGTTTRDVETQTARELQEWRKLPSVALARFAAATIFFCKRRQDLEIKLVERSCVC